MVICELKKEIESLLGIRDAQLLITGMLSLSVTEYAMNQNMIIDHDTALTIRQCANRILSGEPLQYVVGYTEFMSLPFNVGPGVLIPRQDTETLVETAISLIGDKSVRVLDIGTGSGCVAISIKHYCPNAEVTSIDISSAALDIAKKNAGLNNTDVRFMQYDIMNSSPEEKFDIIVSNPPYIPTNDINSLSTTVKDHEPLNALDGGIDGLDFYRHIAQIAPMILSPNGNIIFEVGHDQASDVCDILAHNFKDITKLSDLCGIERVVCAKLSI